MTKSFRGYVPIEAPTFNLESPDGQRVLEVKCVGMLPGSRFLDFMAQADGDSPKEMSAAITDLFKAAVVDYDTFKAFIDDANNGISMDTLSEVAGYLGELYSNRPTEPSPQPSPG